MAHNRRESDVSGFTGVFTKAKTLIVMLLPALSIALVAGGYALYQGLSRGGHDDGWIILADGAQSPAGPWGTPDGAQGGLSASDPKPNEPRHAAEIVVDVKGAVRLPGVYALPEGSRVRDAISEAGGLTEAADRDRINLAARLVDAMVVYIPAKGEDKAPEIITGGAGGGADARIGPETARKVNINTADAKTLSTLPGIGPTRAQAIIDYRTEHGPFRDIAELKNVSGIGPKTFEKLAPYVTVGP